MKYISISINLFFLYLKRFFSVGKWNISSWQNIHPSVKLFVKKKGIMNLGIHNIIERYGNIYVGEKATLSIGNCNYFNQGLIISCQDEVMIGNNCLFGPNVLIYDNNHKFSKEKGVSFALNKEKVEIGDNCWIASNVTILKGTSIGKNCVIGANCVVSGKIPENSIVTQNRNLEIKQMRDAQ